MINLSYKFDQNSCSLELLGMPDVSNGDSPDTIGIVSSWTLKIIGSSLLEGEKEHLDNLMQAVFLYSRAYISGIRKSFISNNKIVTISPLGVNHKLLLKSTKKDVSPLEIILDDSELSDLTRCLDLLRYDIRFNVNWNIHSEKPYSKKYIYSNSYKSRINLNVFYSFFIFIFSCSLLLLIPIKKEIDPIDRNNNSHNQTNQINLLS
tara:strand:+ start:657 stop:1274 length:618 start_codon:yes stop_codon:yes gene_type:complete